MLGELSGVQIDKVLANNVIGRLGCHDMNETYVVPITYVYDGAAIIGHSAPGKKINMMRSNPRVCFQIDQMQNMRSWQSVVVWGRYEELKGKEAVMAMDIFTKKLSPLMTSETSKPIHEFSQEKFNPADMKSIVFKINIGKKTGRFEKEG
ncbi:MAG: pyridoxamine 5'-phosphate oxidase family protein [Saprospiraceae bacterium]|nr:pyridoxamine 5'-phosphate oxidase family protein [Saprospiraceae bacterium]